MQILQVIPMDGIKLTDENLKWLIYNSRKKSFWLKHKSMLELLLFGSFLPETSTLKRNCKDQC